MPDSGRAELGKGVCEGGLKIQERFETNQFDCLHDSGIAEQGELSAAFLAVLDELHQGPQA
jgi:hypothetical protein